jgi:hypothetical protein
VPCVEDLIITTAFLGFHYGWSGEYMVAEELPMAAAKSNG